MAVFRISGKLIKTVIFAFAVVVVVLIVTGNSAPKRRLPNQKHCKRQAAKHHFLTDRKGLHRTGVTDFHSKLIVRVKRSTFLVSEWG